MECGEKNKPENGQFSQDVDDRSVQNDEGGDDDEEEEEVQEKTLEDDQEDGEQDIIQDDDEEDQDDDEEGEEVEDETLEENQEDGEQDIVEDDIVLDDVDYYKICLDHFNPERLNELLEKDRHLLHEHNRPRLLHTCRRHHIWFHSFCDALKVAAAKEDETKEWADNQPAALIGKRSFFLNS